MAKCLFQNNIQITLFNLAKLSQVFFICLTLFKLTSYFLNYLLSYHFSLSLRTEPLELKTNFTDSNSLAIIEFYLKISLSVKHGNKKKITVANKSTIGQQTTYSCYQISDN